MTQPGIELLSQIIDEYANHYAYEPVMTLYHILVMQRGW